jgi:hypothetical protein
MESTTTELSSARSKFEPKFFYRWLEWEDQLERANYLTGERSLHQMPGFRFGTNCRCSELPEGILLITGGEEVKDVWKIHTLREWAASALPPMQTARFRHAAVYHSQYLYVLGGKVNVA